MLKSVGTNRRWRGGMTISLAEAKSNPAAKSLPGLGRVAFSDKSLICNCARLYREEDDDMVTHGKTTEQRL